MAHRNIIGLDLGGANLKLVDSDRQVINLPFPLWTDWQQLKAMLAEQFQLFDQPQLIALTMTGELADCFRSQAEGVRYLTEATVQAADGIPVHVWQTSGEFVEPDVACEFPSLTAAANWHALATWVSRALGVQESGLLIDIGSTTTDLIPLTSGLPYASGLTDYERLQSGELIYTGGARTPVCAVTRSVTVPGSAFSTVTLAAELFATMLDVFLILGMIDEDCQNCNTADGRPADLAGARRRLSRMLCLDPDVLTKEQLHSIALQIHRTQCEQISQGLQLVMNRLPDPPSQLILSGSSEYLARIIAEAEPRISQAERLSMKEMFGSEISSAACAFALTQLAGERL